MPRLTHIVMANGNIRMPRAEIERASNGRPPGFVDECLRIGKPIEDGENQLVEFTAEQMADLRERFPKPGLGDRIHAIAGPIGRKIGWPCMKGDGTTELKPGSPCAKARKALNKITPA
jgi:hypothetical protein